MSRERQMNRDMFLAAYSELRPCDDTKYQDIENRIERMYGWRDGAWYYIELHPMHFTAKRV